MTSAAINRTEAGAARRSARQSRSGRGIGARPAALAGFAFDAAAFEPFGRLIGRIFELASRGEVPDGAVTEARGRAIALCSRSAGPDAARG